MLGARIRRLQARNAIDQGDLEWVRKEALSNDKRLSTAVPQAPLQGTGLLLGQGKEMLESIG